MGDLLKELAGFNRAARPVEFDSAGALVRGRHPAVTPEILEGQHSIRAWEYSIALRALESWIAAYHPTDPPHFADVGCAGSRFWVPLIGHTSEDVARIDPALEHEPHEDRGQYQNFNLSLADYTRLNGMTGRFDAVFCLSVLEHVGGEGDAFGETLQFLSDLRSLVRPGGLLMLTCDMGEHSEDTYHFHWMRKWMPTPAVLAGLVEEACIHYGFRRLGTPADFEFRGPTCFDYTVAAIALVKQ